MYYDVLRAAWLSKDCTIITLFLKLETYCSCSHHFPGVFFFKVFIRGVYQVSVPEEELRDASLLLPPHVFSASASAIPAISRSQDQKRKFHTVVVNSMYWLVYRPHVVINTVGSIDSMYCRYLKNVFVSFLVIFTIYFCGHTICHMMSYVRVGLRRSPLLYNVYKPNSIEEWFNLLAVLLLSGSGSKVKPEMMECDQITFQEYFGIQYVDVFSV